ncbi:hypothetical protein [Methylomagnum ishizawai]|uniref:hypothetical protein n=1 Tax=Methylomagnum ishizawai TaxID=1760988 RepID=UPI000F73C84A|nr:hypothetical protein [Methylomagnum ishizawai]
MSKESESVVSIPNLVVTTVEGILWVDGWMTRELRIICKAIHHVGGLEFALWNPDSSIKYAGNNITLICNKRKWIAGNLAMGEKIDLYAKLDVSEGGIVDITIVSDGFMESDAMDSRRRGIVIVSMLAHLASSIEAQK